MADQKRLVRMLDEILKVPGNNNCADCKSPAPRWASVNLGIFICVSCATIHRGLGTHHSRVKSVTLDSWTRDQVMALKTIGNTASNLIYNPDERRNPPPTSSSTSERDSEMEKYIRKKYEQGAFKAGATAGAKTIEPTSMNRYRHYNQAQSDRGGGGVGVGAGAGVGGSRSKAEGGDMDPWDRPSQNQSRNPRNPELNDLVIKSERIKAEERELPPLPVSASSTGPTVGRERPKPTSSPAPPGSGLGIPPQRTQQQQQLVDLSASSSNSTLPLQQHQHLSPNPFTTLGSSASASTPQGYGSYMSNSAPAFSPNQQGQGQGQGSYFQTSSSTIQPQSQSFGSQSASTTGYNPFLQQQQQQHQHQQQGGFFAQQPQQGQQGQMFSPNTGMGMHHTNPFFSSQSTPNPTLGYTPQMAVQQAMAGPQQQIFPSHTQTMRMGQSGYQGQAQGQGWGYNPQQQQQMGWGNGQQMGYTYAQGQ